MRATFALTVLIKESNHELRRLKKNKEYITIIIVNVFYSFQISITYKLE
jgi:hypothetical protein